MNLDAFIERAGALRVLNFRISQDGREIARHEWDYECRRNIYSATKSFTAAAVGIAQREGLLSIDERLVDAFPDELPETVSEPLEKATVRDLLTMGLGQSGPHLMGDDRPLIEDDNWVRVSLKYPFSDLPGTRFLYNNVGPYLAGVLVQRRAGCDLSHYLFPRMLAPMGYKQVPTWEIDPKGYSFGAGGMFLTLEELHKLGLLFLQDGAWSGRQLVPKDWVRECTRRQIDNGSYGYGYLFWAGPHDSWRADGKYGQLSIILRDKNAVISLTAECRETDRLMDAIFEEIYPQL